jgi:hypothetical protein
MAREKGVVLALLATSSLRQRQHRRRARPPQKSAPNSSPGGNKKEPRRPEPAGSRLEGEDDPSSGFSKRLPARRRTPRARLRCATTGGGSSSGTRSQRGEGRRGERTSGSAAPVGGSREHDGSPAGARETPPAEGQTGARGEERARGISRRFPPRRGRPDRSDSERRRGGASASCLRLRTCRSGDSRPAWADRSRATIFLARRRAPGGVTTPRRAGRGARQPVPRLNRPRAGKTRAPATILRGSIQGKRPWEDEGEASPPWARRGSQLVSAQGGVALTRQRPPRSSSSSSRPLPRPPWRSRAERKAWREREPFFGAGGEVGGGGPGRERERVKAERKGPRPRSVEPLCPAPQCGTPKLRTYDPNK